MATIFSHALVVISGDGVDTLASEALWLWLPCLGIWLLGKPRARTARASR